MPRHSRLLTDGEAHGEAQAGPGWGIPGEDVWAFRRGIWGLVWGSNSRGHASRVFMLTKNGDAVVLCGGPGDAFIEVRVQAVRLKPRPLAAVRLTLAL